MQKIILACVFAIAVTCVFAQNIVPKADPRVADYFGEDKIEHWQNSSPDSILYYNFIASHVFEVYSQEYIDAVHPENIQTIHLGKTEIKALESDQNSFNIFNSKINWKESDNRWFRIEGTNLYLLIHNIDYINAKFNSGK